MKKGSAVNKLKPFKGEPPELNLCRALYGRYIDETEPAFFFNYVVRLVNDLRMISVLAANKKQDKALELDLSIRIMELGARVKNEIVADNARFFQRLADFLEAFPPTEPPEATTYWPVVSPEYFAAMDFLADHGDGEFTRDELAYWIQQGTGKRLPASTITEILDRFHRKARKQKPSGRPKKNKYCGRQR